MPKRPDHIDQSSPRGPGARVAVLKGGWSPEREVSLRSGEAAAAALSDAGFVAIEIDAGRELAGQISEAAPDVAFNALHGQWGEDGCVQGLLEVLGVPYTHSGVLASSLAMDKQRAKAVFEDHGIRCPAGKRLTRAAVLGGDTMAPPFVLKPNAQGSSVGVLIIRERSNSVYATLASPDWAYGDDLLMEEFIPGRELTVSVMGDRPLCVTEIVTDLAFYDYEAKYAAGGSRHIAPAVLPPDVTEACLNLAQRAHDALGCRGLTRADFRWDDRQGVDGLYCLEVNTQPGLTETSLSPEQAAACGISFADLCAWMVAEARLGA